MTRGLKLQGKQWTCWQQHHVLSCKFLTADTKPNHNVHCFPPTLPPSLQALPLSQLTPCKRQIEVVSHDFIRSLCVDSDASAPDAAAAASAPLSAVASLTIGSTESDARAQGSMPPTPNPTSAAAADNKQPNQLVQQQAQAQAALLSGDCKEGSLEGVTSMAVDAPAVSAGTVAAACDKAGAAAPVPSKQLRSPAKSLRRPSQARLGDISNMPR